MSREHYVSEALLRVFTDAPFVRGMGWQVQGEAQQIGIGALQSRILCRQHNSDLAPLDAVLAEMQTFAELVHASFNSADEAGSHFELELDGPLLERGLLKFVFGLTHSRSFTSVPGRPSPDLITAARRDRLLRALFGVEPLDDVGGLFSLRQALNPGAIASWSGRCEVNDNNEVIGADFLFRRMHLAISLDATLQPSRFALRRPAAITWRTEDGTQTARLVLDWH